MDAFEAPDAQFFKLKSMQRIISLHTGNFGFFWLEGGGGGGAKDQKCSRAFLPITSQYRTLDLKRKFQIIYAKCNNV